MDQTQLYSHLERLERHHHTLDQNITEGFTFYLDDATLSKMKQERLMVKRQIVELKEQLGIK